jgi:predicted ATPase
LISSITFNNFYSYVDTTTLSFILRPNSQPTYFDLHESGVETTNLAACVIGANGSGKTQALMALAFISDFCNGKQELNIAHNKRVHLPTELMLDFYIEKTKYRYELSLLDDNVLTEALYKKTSRQYSYVFEVDNTQPKKTIKVSGNKNNTLIDKYLPANESLFTLTTNLNNPDIIIASNFLKSFEHNLFANNTKGKEEEESIQFLETLYDKPRMHAQLNKLLSQMDLGVHSIVIEKNPDNNNAIEAYGEHIVNKKTIKLPLSSESRGTKLVILLLSKIIPAFEKGTLCLINDMDENLHPMLLGMIVNLFSVNTEAKHPQLLFSSSKADILEKFKKHQVFITDKSTLYRVDEITGLRNDANIYTKYMTGALGGVPNI